MSGDPGHSAQAHSEGTSHPGSSQDRVLGGAVQALAPGWLGGLEVHVQWVLSPIAPPSGAVSEGPQSAPDPLCAWAGWKPLQRWLQDEGGEEVGAHLSGPSG